MKVSQSLQPHGLTTVLRRERRLKKWKQWKISFNKTKPHRKVSCLQTRHNQLHHTGMVEKARKVQKSFKLNQGFYLNYQGSPFQFPWSPSSLIIVLPHKRPYDFYLSSLVLWYLNQEFVRLPCSYSLVQSEITSPLINFFIIFILPRKVLWNSCLVYQSCASNKHWFYIATG